MAWRLELVNGSVHDLTGVTVTLSETVDHPQIGVVGAPLALGTMAAGASATVAVQADLGSGLATPWRGTMIVTITHAGAGSWAYRLPQEVFTSTTLSGLATLDGAPAPGVTVHYSGEVIGSVVTGSDGRYAVVLPSDAYLCYASCEDWVPTAGSTVATTGDATYDVAFTTATISGTVHSGLDGTAVADATVRVHGLGIDRSATGTWSLSHAFGKPTVVDVDATHPLFSRSSLHQATLPPDAAGLAVVMTRPTITVDTPAVIAHAAPSTTITVPITIGNLGNDGLTWLSRKDLSPGALGFVAAAAGQVLNDGHETPLVSGPDTLNYPRGMSFHGRHVWYGDYDPIWVGRVRVRLGCLDRLTGRLVAMQDLAWLPTFAAWHFPYATCYQADQDRLWMYGYAPPLAKPFAAFGVDPVTFEQERQVLDSNGLDTVGWT